MDIDLIMKRGQSGETLNVMEIAALMHHAISLLSYARHQPEETIEQLPAHLPPSYRQQQFLSPPLY